MVIKKVNNLYEFNTEDGLINIEVYSDTIVFEKGHQVLSIKRKEIKELIRFLQSIV